MKKTKLKFMIEDFKTILKLIVAIALIGIGIRILCTVVAAYCGL